MVNFTLTDEGPGSPGNETDYFGSLTRDALMDLQSASGLTTDGIYGAETREMFDQIIQIVKMME